jgi:multidrug efflux pump subunit AcrA (membrane-fusion protein)
MNRNLSRGFSAVRRGGLRAGIATLVAGTIAATGCAGEPEPVAEVARPVRLVEIGFAGASGWREYPGVVAAVQRADMAFEVPGLIISMPVTEGQEVARGRLLAQLDARDFEARRDADRARRSAARADYERHM